MSSLSPCRIVILNYNGRKLLESCLPSIVEAAGKSRRACGVTVLDNCSVDDSRDYVQSRFPSVEWIGAPANKILCSYNDYARTASEEYLIFLNNDIKLEPGFVDPLMDSIEADPNVFFAAPMSRQYDTGEYEGSRSKMELRWGLLRGDARFAGHEKGILEPSLTMQCGFGVFRRSFFLTLGGYDALYLPGTVEDSDLCFRGYRQGWTDRYVPQSIAHHMGQATFKKAFGSSGLRRLNRRNLYLFMWKNVRDPLLLAGHLLCIPLQLARHLARGEWEMLAGFGDACRLLPRALASRRAARIEKTRVGDQAIFKLSKHL